MGYRKGSAKREIFSIERLQYLVLLSLLLAIIPFGAVRPYALSFATLFAAAVGMLAIAVLGISPKTGSLFAIVFATGAIAVVAVILQTVDVPQFLANPIWTNPLSGAVPLHGSISIEPADSIAAILFFGLPWLTFLTVLTVIRRDEDARKILVLLSIGGGLISIYGIVQFVLFPGSTLIFYPKDAYTDSLTATFVNRNSAGTFAGLTVLLLARYCHALSERIHIGHLARRLIYDHLKVTDDVRRFLFIASLLGCSTLALFLTKSRGAIGSTLVAIALFIVLTAIFPKAHRASATGLWLRWKSSINRAVLGLVLAFLVLGAFGGRALMRLETQGTQDGRFCVLPGIVDLAKAQPLLGSGFGTFRFAFSPYRDAQCGIYYVWQRAHNFYLEGYIGLGAVFLLLLLMLTFAFIIVQVIGMTSRIRMRSYSALGLASLTLVAIQSLVDFSLEIPGIAAYLAAVLAATSSVSLGRSLEDT